MEYIDKDKTVDINISTEIKNSFLDYSMSVIVSRAIPDVRDGLKPVHRRILYTFFKEGITSDKTYKKSATTCGKVMAYHPHGDAAIYDTMARMAQDFSYRYPLIDGKGAFGAPDGSSPAASRYTEARLSKISAELLRDINKNSVDFIPNYDGETVEPRVLPSRYPNILVNGNIGIAVGMATNIPPHNLTETIDGLIKYIDNEEISLEELMLYIKGPDFPTGGKILGNSGIKQAYETGRGTIVIRGKVEIEEHGDSSKLIITEIPYQINYTNIIKKIAELVRDKEIDGISNLTDESALEGIKIVIDVKKGYNPKVVLNNLYKYTQLQTSIGVNFLMLVDGRPRTLPLKEILKYYLEHQMNVIYRRTKFDLDRSEKQFHILEGLKIATDHIDEIIQIIKTSKNEKEIKIKFAEKYKLTEIQSEAILEMKLRRLSSIERAKIEDELEKLKELIAQLKLILSSDEEIKNVIKEELLEIKNKYGDERRTTIDMTAIEYIEDESLIPVEDIVVTMTSEGYIKRVDLETYRTQNRGGVGVRGMGINEEDFVENLISLTTHDYILFFTNKGKVYRSKGYTIPHFGRQSKGIPIVNLLQLDKDEKVTVLLKMGEEEEKDYVVFCTQNGLVKRTKISEFNNIRVTGKIAITLKDNDELISVKKTSGENEIMIATSDGRMIRFHESEVRVMGRTASGVRGINIGNSYCIGCEVITDKELVLVVTEKGYGKKTSINEYRTTHRATKGVKTLNITEKNGKPISFRLINNSENLMIITDSGIIIKIPTEQISQTGRVSQGVKLINLKNDQTVSSIALINSDNNEDHKEHQSNS